jgi:hypothetical protein
MITLTALRWTGEHGSVDNRAQKKPNCRTPGLGGRRTTMPIDSGSTGKNHKGQSRQPQALSIGRKWDA